MPRITSKLRIAHEKVSTASINRYGDSGQPCLAPLSGANNHEAGDLRLQRANYDVIVMFRYNVHLQTIPAVL